MLISGQFFRQLLYECNGISLQNVLEKCVLQYVDNSDINVIKRIAHCVAFFPLLGGGGSLGANHVSRWRQEQLKVCATLHCILDELFDNVREIPVCTLLIWKIQVTSFIYISNYVITLSLLFLFFQSCHNSVTLGEVLSLPPISGSAPVLRVYQLMARFINVSKFLQALLM